MSILDAFDGLVAAHIRDFIELGRMRYSRTPASALEQRRSLGIQTEAADFEILVWSTGDVEFGYGTVGDNHDEHLDSASELDLEALIQRLLELARTWRQE